MTYELAWGIYAVACLIATLCFFGLTKAIKPAVVRWALRMPFVAVCFTPVYIDGTEQIWFAPNIAALALELVAKDMDSAINHLMPLAVMTALSMVLGLIIGLLIENKKKAD